MKSIKIDLKKIIKKFKRKRKRKSKTSWITIVIYSAMSVG
jgi:hypothetical protein